MNDYLENLAARALNQAVVIQPRVPSLFESQWAAEDSLAPRLDAAASNHDVVASEPVQIQTHASSGQSRLSAASVFNLHEIEKSDRGASIDRMEREPQSTTTSAREQDHPGVTAAAPAAPAPSNPLAPACRPPVINLSIPRAARARSSGHRPAERAWGIRREFNEIPLPRPASPVGASTKPASSIQVTIGRIEVRAVTELPKNTPKESVSLPALTLDEYLNQRRKGER